MSTGQHPARLGRVLGSLVVSLRASTVRGGVETDTGKHTVRTETVAGLGRARQRGDRRGAGMADVAGADAVPEERGRALGIARVVFP